MCIRQKQRRKTIQFWQIFTTNYDSSVLAVVLHNSLILLNDALPVDDILEQVHVPHACCGSPGGSTGGRNFESVHHLVSQRRRAFRRPIRCLFRPWVLHSRVHSSKVSDLSLTSCACRKKGALQKSIFQEALFGSPPCLQSLTSTTFQYVKRLMGGHAMSVRCIALSKHQSCHLNLMVFGGFWWFLAVFGGIWWYLMVFGGPWFIALSKHHSCHINLVVKDALIRLRL